MSTAIPMEAPQAPAAAAASLGTYMNDGERKVDFILAYKETVPKTKSSNLDEIKERRQYFEENLEKEGLELETDRVVQKGETVVFVKVHVPWKTLCKHAERLQVKAQLKIRDKRFVKSKPTKYEKPKKAEKNVVEVIPMTDSKVSATENVQTVLVKPVQEENFDDKAQDNKTDKNTEFNLLFPVVKNEETKLEQTEVNNAVAQDNVESAKHPHHHKHHHHHSGKGHHHENHDTSPQRHHSNKNQHQHASHEGLHSSKTQHHTLHSGLHSSKHQHDQQRHTAHGSHQHHDDKNEHHNRHDQSGHGHHHHKHKHHDGNDTSGLPPNSSVPVMAAEDQKQEDNKTGNDGLMLIKNMEVPFNNSDTAPIIPVEQVKPPQPDDGLNSVLIHWPFRRKRVDMFEVINQISFFSEKHRIEIAYEILQKVGNDPNEEKKRGIEVLLEHNIYEAAYPLHDGDVSPEGKNNTIKTNRQYLNDNWANWNMAFRKQPLTEVRNYFGEKIGFYFGWMELYTKMLILPAFVGLVTFIIGLVSAANNPELDDLCKEEESSHSLNEHNSYPSSHHEVHGLRETRESHEDDHIAGYWMCPVCQPPGCSAWEMREEGCFQYSWAFRFDTPWSFLLSSFTSLWVILFLKLWKRRETTLAAEWGTEEVEEQDIVIRPEYEERAPQQRRNPVTRELEPYVPAGVACLWQCASILATILFLLFACLCLIVLVICRVALYSALRNVHKNVDVSRWMVHGLIFIVVTILELAYTNVAHRLTNYECKRTEKQFMNSLLWKIFLFQMLNELIPLGYAAWVKGRTSRTPLNMGVLDELCDGGCMGEVTELVSVLLLLRLVFGNISEIAIPYLQNKLKKFKSTKDMKDAKNSPQYLKDYHLGEVELDGVYEEYLEMMTQFAFIALFIPALPVAPLVCFLNNIAEIRVDAIKMLLARRRPLPIRVSGIGIWNKFLNIINKLGILCNAALLAFTSDNIPKLYYRFKYNPGVGYQGVTKFTLSKVPVEGYGLDKAHDMIHVNNITHCWYPDFREETYPYNLKEFYWEIFCLRLVVFAAYCIVFFTLTWVVNTFISDVPEAVKTKIRRRQYVVFKAMELEAAAKQTKASTENAQNTTAA